MYPKEAKAGTAIRHYRQKKRMTLRELASRTRLSVSFLSQVERGICSITLVSLRKIADAMGVNLRSIVALDEPESFVKRKENSVQIHLEKSYTSYVLLSGKFENREMEALILTMEPRMADAEESSHEGEEFFFVLQGMATITVEGEKYVIPEGESIHFPSFLRHKVMNLGDKTLRMVSVVTPRIF
jgi:transcriptional regulator with XRE-family HTH domain